MTNNCDVEAYATTISRLHTHTHRCYCTCDAFWVGFLCVYSNLSLSPPEPSVHTKIHPVLFFVCALLHRGP